MISTSIVHRVNEYIRSLKREGRKLPSSTRLEQKGVSYKRIAEEIGGLKPSQLHSQTIHRLVDAAIEEIGIEEHPMKAMERRLSAWIDGYRREGRPLPSSTARSQGAATPNLQAIAMETGIPLSMLQNTNNPFRVMLNEAIAGLGLEPSPGDKVFAALDAVLKEYEDAGKPLPHTAAFPDRLCSATLAKQVGCDLAWLHRPRMRTRIDRALARVGLDTKHLEDAALQSLETYFQQLHLEGAGLPASGPHQKNYSPALIAKDAGIDPWLLARPRLAERLAAAAEELGVQRPERKYAHAIPGLTALIGSWRTRGLTVPCSPKNLEAPDYEAIAEGLDVPKHALWQAPLAGMLQAAITELGIGPHVDLSALPTTPITYGDLINRAPQATRSHLSPSTWSVYNSHLRSYMRACGKTESDSVGPELSSRFHSTFNAWAQEHGFPSRKAQQLRSSLYTYVYAHSSLARGDAIPANFAAALRLLVSLPGVVRSHIEKTCGIKRDVMWNWLKDGCAPRGSEGAVKRIEEYFELPAGTLTSLVSFNPRTRRSFCPPTLFPEPYRVNTNRMMRLRTLVKHQLPDDFEYFSDDERQRLVRETLRMIEDGETTLPFRSRYNQLRQLTYHFPFEKWPQHLQDEWGSPTDGLRTFKTAPTPARGMRRRSAWSSKGTVQKNLTDMQHFFGWLLLDSQSEDPLMRGKGMAPEELTFALLLDTDLFEEYLAWRAKRSGALNGQSLTHLQMCKSHLGSHGWLRQRPDLMRKILPRIEAGIDVPKALPDMRPKTGRAIETYADAISVWNELCDEAHARYSQIHADYRNVRNGTAAIKKTRDPFEPILPILEAEMPIAYLEAMHAAIRREVGNMTAHLERQRFKQLVLSRLLTLYPLRASHWAALTYREDNSGHLKRFEEDGRVFYEIHFSREEFKNSYSAIFGRADAPIGFVGVIQGDLVEDLDTYLGNCRPQLLGGQDHHHVFLGQGGNIPSTSTIYSMIKSATGRYLAERGPVGLRVRGVHHFGPHAYRHIVATNAIKATGSVEIAANILLDSVGVTRRTYTRFIPRDRVAHAIASVTHAQPHLHAFVGELSQGLAPPPSQHRHPGTAGAQS